MRYSNIGPFKRPFTSKSFTARFEYPYCINKRGIVDPFIDTVECKFYNIVAVMVEASVNGLSCARASANKLSCANVVR